VGQIVAIGERARVRGFALVGVTVIEAEGTDAARAAWQTLPAGVELVILTRAAHTALTAGGAAGGPAGPLSVVMA